MGSRFRGGLRDGRGDSRPPWIAGSMGDSGESNDGSRFLGASIALANCSCRGGDAAEGSSLGCKIHH